MAQYHAKSLRKKTGGMRRAHHKKKKYETGGVWVSTKIGEEKLLPTRQCGGKVSRKLHFAQFVNLTDSATKKNVRIKITGIIENTANPHYVRRGFITKGTVITTEQGNARITSRPGQGGVLNAVLLVNETSEK